jgi:hypothetical protein
MRSWFDKLTTNGGTKKLATKDRSRSAVKPAPTTERPMKDHTAMQQIEVRLRTASAEARVEDVCSRAHDETRNEGSRGSEPNT